MRRMPFSLPNTTITITMNAITEGWGSHCCLPGSTMALYSTLWSKSEWKLSGRALQDKGFSDAAIMMILTATHGS